MQTTSRGYLWYISRLLLSLNIIIINGVTNKHRHATKYFVEACVLKKCTWVLFGRMHLWPKCKQRRVPTYLHYKCALICSVGIFCVKPLVTVLSHMLLFYQHRRLAFSVFEFHCIDDIIYLLIQLHIK